MPTGVLIYTSQRLEDLLRVLAERLATAPLPPLVNETILVPGQGMARWLRYALAEQHGIAAGLELPFAGAWLQQLARERSGSATADVAARFGLEALVFRIHRLLGEPALRRDLGAAAHYCTDDPDGRKRFQLSQRLAACFDDYQLYRPDLLDRMAQGDDLQKLGDHGRWQARLWRALLADAPVAADAGPERDGPSTDRQTGYLFAELAPPRAPEPGGDNSIDPTASGAHRVAHLRALLNDPERARRALPPRLSIFGTSTLPPALLQLFELVAQHIPVVFYVPSPAPGLLEGLDRRTTQRFGGNPLLASLGTEAREFQRALADIEVDERRDLHAPTVRAPRTLLECIQQDITFLRDRRAGSSDAPPFELAAGDHSLLVHDCHSEQREMEVVRDQILRAFAEDETLEPHDVLVLVPDIERYAPFAQAVFGPVADHVPFTVADKSPRSESPICAALFQTLRLAQDRLAVFDVLHLLEEPAVQRRFGIFGNDLQTLRHLCDRAGIRWGVDGAMREEQFQVPAFEDNSWRHGLERMLLGVATGPTDDLVLGHLPAADTTAGREVLVARLAHFADTLFALLRGLQRPLPLAQWADRIDELAGALFLPSTGTENQGVADLHAAAAALRAHAATAAHQEPVSNLVLQDWLEFALGRTAASQGFLSGKVTIAALLPMRAVPVRQLFLCGLDDQAFPRVDRPAPFDLAAVDRRPGDRSLRLDDRQMFLDCLMAARDRLHLTHVGHSQKDDSECAPSVVLAELLEVIDRCAVTPEGRDSAASAVHVRHPLQVWSSRYLTGHDDRLFTYRLAGADFAGSDALPAAAAPEQPFCAEPLNVPEPADRAVIPLATLVDFFWHPCRWFLRNTLQLRLPRSGDEATATEPFEVDGLSRWRIHYEALQRRQRDLPPPDLALTRASGQLPVGGTGAALFAGIEAEFARFAQELDAHGELRACPIAARSDDALVRGELPGVGTNAVVYARVAYLGAKDRLRGWVLHVAAAVARHQGADLPAETVLIGRQESKRFLELPAAMADEQLRSLIAAFRAGIVAPLPLIEKSSMAYAEQLDKQKEPQEALRQAAQKWHPSQRPGNPVLHDSEDENHALAMRGRDPFALPEFAEWSARIWRPALSYLRDE